MVTSDLGDWSGPLPDGSRKEALEAYPWQLGKRGKELCPPPSPREASSSQNCHSDAKKWPTLCNPMNCNMPGFPVRHHLPEFAQTRVHWVSDALQPSHPLWSPSPLVFSPSIRSFPMSPLFISGGQSIGASASPPVLPMNIQGWFPLGLAGLITLQSKGLSRLFSSTIVWKHSLVLSLLYGPILTSVLEKR